jgi:hypothetical protein
MDGWLPRLLRWPGSLRRAVVGMAAVVLAGGALGFLLWSLATRSSAQLAWLTSMATIWAVVLPAWGMSVAMLIWVKRSVRPAADPVRQFAKPAAGKAGADPETDPQENLGPQAAGPATLVRLAAVGVRGQYIDAWALRKVGTVRHWWRPREDGSPGWDAPEFYGALPDGGGPVADMAAASRGPGHAEVFAVDRRGSLWHRRWCQVEGWAEWQQFADHVAAPVAACSFADGQIQVFVTDSESNVVKYRSSPDPATWDPWTVVEALGGLGSAALAQLVTAGVRGQNLDAWALRVDGKISHSWWPRADRQRAWSEPEDFFAPDGMVDIAAASHGPGHTEIFAVDGHGTLWHRCWRQGEGWASWQQFADHIAAPVAACSFANGQIQVFVTDPAGNLLKYRSSPTPGRWDPWETLG